MKKTLIILLAASLCSFSTAQEGMILKNGPIVIELNQEAGVSMQSMPKPHNMDKKYKNVMIDDVRLSDEQVNYIADKIIVTRNIPPEEAEFSEHGRKFVFFIRIAGELMRVNQWDKESGKLQVTRGYKGSRASHHDKGDIVTSPIYNSGGTPIIERRGQELVEYMQQGYDCANLDAMSATIPQFRMVNAITMKTGPWNFEKNRPYSVDEWVEGHDRMVGVMQRYAYAATGRWGEITLGPSTGKILLIEPSLK